ncbi:MAG: YbaK/EbsC family protein [Acidobacteria bacterium]|nr:YbaK/EbsC family protein [Acidobacteriota bacterium]
MSICARLREYLDDNNIKYTASTHSAAYTAQELAAVMHVHGREMAKVVIVKLDGQFAMLVLPGHHQINFEQLKAATGANHIELASELEFQNLFPDCEVGAMPPFGNLYGMPVYVARPLTDDEEIVFNAGTHRDAIRMKGADYGRLVNPTVLDFTYVP